MEICLATPSPFGPPRELFLLRQVLDECLAYMYVLGCGGRQHEPQVLQRRKKGKECSTRGRAVERERAV